MDKEVTSIQSRKVSAIKDNEQQRNNRFRSEGHVAIIIARMKKELRTRHSRNIPYYV